MKRLLILIRPDPAKINDILDSAKKVGATVHEFLPTVFVIHAGPRGIVDEPLTRALVGTSYVLASYTAARANDSSWVNALGVYAESRVGEPSDRDRYVLVHNPGLAANIDFAQALMDAGISAKQLTRGVYIATPHGDAATFSQRIGETLKALPRRTAVVRLGNFTSSVPI